MSSSAKRRVFLSGNEAIAQGAYEAGVRVACAYPGTPSSEILEYLSSYSDIDTQWSVNEKVAYEVAFSSSIGGLRSLYASKHVGVNVAMDPLMSSAYSGVNAGFVVVTCDDPGLHSSQNEQDNRFIASLAKLPLLEPSSPKEAKSFVKIAFNISERFDIPVMVRLTTRVSHTKEDVLIKEREVREKKEFSLDVSKYVLVPRNAYRRHIDLEKRINKLTIYSERSSLNRIELNSTKIGFIASGVAYLYTKEMYPDASFLKLGMSFPFPHRKVEEFIRMVKKIYVVEELEPFLEGELRKISVKVRVKHSSFRVGELRPEFIPFIVEGKSKPRETQAARKPVMCPGCPHRPVFWVLKKLKLVVTGDIGCYTLGALPPLSSLHTCLCMGSGVTFFEGLKKALNKNIVGVIGDSTFVHSGITSLVNLAYNKTKGLIIILDNSTTAMTGAQPHPATGITIKNEPTKKLVLEEVCYACGADNVDVVNPFKVDKLESIIKKRVNEEALSVLITRFPCRLITKKRLSPPSYNKRKCTKCYMCLMIDCPAITKTEDGFIEINPYYCVGCGLCVEVCKFSALSKSDG